jgi:hypothetical protein
MAEPATNKTWEYRIERDSDETKLTKLGGQGWEIVAVVVQYSIHFAYLKRQVRF